MKSNCHVSKHVSGCCDICGSWPKNLHMPEDLHGWYCPGCCPACKVQAIAQPRVGVPEPEAAPAAA